jgi:hypothetical protein
LGLHCVNTNCIVHDPMEAQYVRNKFFVVKSDVSTRLRCVYCEREIEHFVVASKKHKWYAADVSALARSNEHGLKDFVLFADESDAQAAGFHSRRATAADSKSQRTRLRAKM